MKPSCVSLDGTKMKANASKHHALSGSMPASSKNNARVKLRNCWAKRKEPTRKIWRKAWISPGNSCAGKMRS